MPMTTALTSAPVLHRRSLPSLVRDPFPVPRRERRFSSARSPAGGCIKRPVGYATDATAARNLVTSVVVYLLSRVSRIDDENGDETVVQCSARVKNDYIPFSLSIR